MRVRVLPCDKGGCAYYRQREPARIAEAEGWEVTIDGDFSLGRDPEGRMVPVTVHPLKKGRIECRPIEADVVILQRPARGVLVELIQAFQGMGTAVVVDIDDDFSALRHNHPAKDGFNPALNSEQNTRHLARACALADLVTVTTPPLADRYGAHGRVAILPNCVPQSMLEMPTGLGDGRTVGWAGAAAIHPGDLEVTSGGVRDALQRMDWRLRVIGPPDDVAERLGVPTVDATGFIEEIAGYHAAIGVFDIGIVPLEASRFNDAKSNLKGLEYAARGVPFVASPRLEYRALADEGVGLLAGDRARNWRSQLLALMEDESLRAEMGARGRAVVEERHTFERQGWRWLEAWQTAVVQRQGTSTVAVPA